MLFSITTTFSQSGTTGDITWKFSNGILTFSGVGKMGDYTPTSQVPWLAYRDDTYAVIIEDGVENIGNYAFRLHTDLAAVSIGNSVKSIGNFAFRDCLNLTQIYMGKNVTSIGNSAFFSCLSLLSIDIPKGITTIGKNAFEKCGLFTSIEIPNTVSLIGERAFADCLRLEEVIILSSSVTIEDWAFSDCPKLAALLILNLVPPTIDTSVFYGSSPIIDLLVPTSAVEAYQEAEIWKDLNIIDRGFVLHTLPNLSEGGYTTGDGLYENTQPATVTATARTGYRFVNWTQDDMVISTDHSFSFPVTGDVSLIAHFEEFVGIEETMLSPEIKLFPNPTTGILTIETGELKIQSIEIIDVYGKKISTHHLINSSSNQIDISHFSAGIYFVKIETDKGQVVKKVVKE